MSSLSDIKLHYLAIPGKPESLGRGEVCNLLLKDSGLKYEYTKLDFAKFKSTKQEYAAKGLVQPTLPYLEVNGKCYGKSTPILRFLAKKLGKYDGKDDDEIQLVDAISDAVGDWYGQWGLAVWGGQTTPEGGETPVEKYNRETFPASVKEFDAVLGKTSGPYLLGDEPTYADFMLYHVVDDSKVTGAPSIADFPNMDKFVKAIESRPNLKDYIASLKN
ncbi:glutathione S-transferase [Backusella circina FSU 941]|nr:glutathione S-transferase [Backusella circina FSU 941]